MNDNAKNEQQSKNTWFILYDQEVSGSALFQIIKLSCSA